MRHFTKRLLALALAAAVCLGMLPAQAAPAPEETAASKDFVVLSTSDVHGKIWDKNVLNDTGVNNSLLKVASAVKEIREQYEEDAVVLIDNGDLYQGTPVSSYHLNQLTQYLKTGSTDGLDGNFITDGTFNTVTPMALALKYIGYDVSVLGNHEFNYAWAAMRHTYDWLEQDKAGSGYDPVAVVSANLYWTEDDGEHKAGDNAFTPYLIKEIALSDGTRVRVGILGFENTDCTRWDIADNYPNISFSAPDNPARDMAVEAERYVARLKDEEHCDFVILSYHSGKGQADGDLSFGTNTESQVTRVVSRTAGIDMVIAGHDHSTGYSGDFLKNKNGEDVLVVNAGGSTLTRSIFTISKDASGLSITYKDTDEKGEKLGANLSLSKYADDETLKALIAPYAAAAEGYVNQTVGTLAGEWNTVAGSACYLAQSDTVDLINRAQIARGGVYLNRKWEGRTIPTGTEKFLALDATTADQATAGSARPALDHVGVDVSCTSIVFSNASSYARAGDLTMKGIYGFYKYDNSLYLLPVTGAELKSILEWNAANRLSARVVNGEARYQTIGDSFTNPVFYGLDFTYDMSRDPGERVVIDRFADGRDFSLDKTYVLAVNNYHLSNGPFAAYTTDDAIWSQTDDLGGGVVQDLIAEFVGEATAAGEDIQPAPAKWKLDWTGSLGPDLSGAVTIAYPVEEIEDGDRIIIHNIAHDATLSKTLKLGTGGEAEGVFYAAEDVAVLTVKASSGAFTLQTADGKYLSTPKSNSITLVDTPNDRCLWKVGKTVNGSVVYHEESGLYLRYYNEKWSTYKPNDPTAGSYSMKLYKVVPSGTKLTQAPADGAKVVLYNTPNQLIVGAGADGSGLAGIGSAGNGSVLGVFKGSALFTVGAAGEKEGKALYTLTCGGKFLTYGASGNSLTLEPAQSELSLWDFEGLPDGSGFHIHATNAAYNGNNNQYLEQYFGRFTTYGIGAGGDNYLFNFYAFDDAQGFTPAPGEDLHPQDPNAYILPVFETTDVHGFLVDVSSGDSATYQYRMAYIANAVAQARQGDNKNALLLDGGDIYQGNVISNLQTGKPLVAAYDLMGYDGVALGNHEFDWGVETVADHDGTMTSYTGLDGAVVDSRVPILACNVFASSPGEFVAGTTPRVDFTRDYVILEKTAVNSAGERIDVKIAVVGYAPDYRGDIMPARIENYTIHSDLSAPEAIAAKLKEDGACDAAILLVHDSAAGVARRLAADTAFDLVLGGHTHQNSTGVTDSGLVYLQTRNQANGYGYAELRFNAEKQLTRVTDNQIVTIVNDKAALYADSDKLEPTVKALTDRSIEAVSEQLEDVLGYIVTPARKGAIQIGEKRYTDTATAGNWLGDLQNRATGAQASFVNNGGIRTDFPFEEGAERRYITVGDIYTIAPFDNEIYVYDVTYAQFKDFFESYLAKNKSMGLRMEGPQIYYTGSTVNAIVLKDADHQDLCVYSAGQWTGDWAERTIRLSFNSYIATTLPMLVEWNGTDKLVDKSAIDNASYVAQLRAEQEETGGVLYVDPNPYIISGEYEPHTHTYAVTKTVKKTETDTGYTEHTCSLCGYSYWSDIVRAGADVPYPSRPTQPDGQKPEEPTPDRTMNFVDVNEGEWYYDAVEYVYGEGLMEGDSAATFSPDATADRAMLATILWRLEGRPESGSTSAFVDVPADMWYTDAINWAAEAGIVEGRDATHFDPAEAITREELATLLYRYIQKGGDGFTGSWAFRLEYADAGEVSQWAYEAVCWCTMKGLVNGRGANSFQPSGTATRAEVATLLARFAAMEE